MGFLLHGSQNYIFFVFYINLKKCRYSTKIKIDRSEWDLLNQRPKVKRGSIGSANRKINDVLNEYQSAFNILKDKHKKSLTKEIVKSVFDKHFHLAQTVEALTYSDYFTIYINQLKESQSVKKDSWQKYTRIHTAILEMQKQNRTTYNLQSFDLDFFNSFIIYLRKDKQISDNTLKRKLGFFKTFLNWCVKNSYAVNMSFKSVSIKGRETSHISLTDQDLKTLEAIELSETLSYFRDLFLIGCYSGQRYSDYSRFDKKYINGDSIVIRAKKTGQFSYIPLNPKLKRLLEKYDWKLLLISSQKFNQKIQMICKSAGFTDVIQADKFFGNRKESKDLPRWKLIGSHTARRSFITLSAQRNVPRSIIMQATGIKSLKTLDNYIRFDNDKMNEEIFKAWS
jgi:site-specific recombinase XerC|tara:strand:- start:20327 stop:21514 length:1188 start_codon:yes stop_codon:yes gene_type:complete